MRISYAKRADVLYIVLHETEHSCVYIELESGVICRIDETTDQVVGITIPDLTRRAEHDETIEIPELDEGMSAARLLQEHHGGE